MKVSLSDLMLGRCITQLGITMSYVEVDVVKVEVAVYRKRQSPNDHHNLWERKRNVCVAVWRESGREPEILLL